MADLNIDVGLTIEQASLKRLEGQLINTVQNINPELNISTRSLKNVLERKLQKS